MAHRRSFFALTLLLLLVAVHPLLAQPDLTQQVQVAGGGLTLTVSYPDGWFSSVDRDDVLIASSAAALDELKSTGVIKTAGETGIGIYLPSFLDNLSLTHDTAPKQAVEGFLTATKSQGSVETSADFAVPAATVLLTPPGLSTKSLIGALAFPDGTVIFGVIPASKLDATAKAIINSITLSSPPGIPEVTPDASVDLTPLVFTVRDRLVDFSLSIGLPEGWVSHYEDGSGFLYLGNSDSALEKANSQSPIYEPGEVSIALLMPPAVPKLGIPRDAMPADAISTFEAHSDAQGRVVSDDTFDVPAAHAALTGGNLPVGGGDIFALQFDGGLVFLVVQPSGAIDGSIMAILHSIQYGPADEMTATAEATAAPAATAVTSAAGKLLRQWAVYVDGTSEYGKEDWSFMQASGEPNTPTCGDNTTAWASEDSTGRAVLRLGFAQPVIASQINIHQSYNPGAIVEVDVGNSSNPSKVLPLPNSADPVGHTDCPGVFSVPVVGVDTPIDFVVIYLDQSLTGDWNEIDAVELVGIPAG